MADQTYQLVVRKGPRPGQVYPLTLETITVGRDPISDIVIDDPEVSRHHARFILGSEGYSLQDMGSTNGSFVDGQRLGGDAVALSTGQVIMLGSNVTLIYQATSASDPLATMVAPAAVPEAKPVEEPEIEIPKVSLPAFEEPEFEEPEIEEPAIPEPQIEVPEIEEVVEDEDEMATVMDFAPKVEEVPPFQVEPEPEPEPEPESEPESEPYVLPAAEPEEPLPAFEDVEEPVEPMFEPPRAVYEEPAVQARVDSGEPFFEPQAVERTSVEPPPVPVTPPAKEKDSNRRTIIIVAAIILLCCCLAAVVVAVLITTETLQFTTAIPDLSSARSVAALFN